MQHTIAKLLCNNQEKKKSVILQMNGLFFSLSFSI